MLMWQTVDDNMKRAKVPGGWLVIYETPASTLQYDGYNLTAQWGHEWRTALCFYPDPEHKWDPKVVYA